MREKINSFLEKQTNMEHLLTACMSTFLLTVVAVVIWALVLVGSWGNLVNTVKFAQILAIVDHIYIGEADTTEVSDAGFTAMIEQLGDRWSYYMTEEQYEHYQQVQTNHYTGIGITIGQTEKGWTVAAVLEDSPADKAGMTAGMLLIEVNGVILTDKTASDISAMIQTDPEHVRILAENTDGKPQLFEMTLETLYSNPVSYEMKSEGVGYIKLKNFDDESAKESIAAVEALVEQGAEAIVFDVRNNSGGYVTQLCDLLDYLLPEGEIFISVDEDGKEDVTRSDKNAVDLPMAVLVNENSYSAAEFFAAALQEYDAAVVVGTRTTGKNRSQTNMILADGSAVHISSKRYLTPNRVDLTEQGGLIPGVEVAIEETDTQLAAALELF